MFSLSVVINITLLLNVFCITFSDVNPEANDRLWRTLISSNHKIVARDDKKTVSRPLDESPLAGSDMLHNRHDMFNIPEECDDGHRNIQIDYHALLPSFICLEDLYTIDVPPVIYQELIPSNYLPLHFCIDFAIGYITPLPTYGFHRPNWGTYGEYMYLPVERWLHNAEHGAIIMLYHPCANKTEVDLLRTTVRSCLWRHIITPYGYVPIERPFVLVAWGWYLAMSTVDVALATQFIKDHALRGPEHVSRDGKFDHLLIKKADIVSDEDDTIVCPSVRPTSRSLHPNDQSSTFTD